MNDPKLSLLIPLFNEEDLLRRNINPIVEILIEKLGFNDFEVLVLINGAELENENLSLPDQVQLISCEEKGKGAAFKKGLTLARAPIIGTLDIDRAWSEEFIIKGYKHLLTTKDQVLFGQKTHPDSKVKRPIIRSIASFFVQSVVSMCFGIKRQDTQCLCLFKREAIANIDGLKSNGFFAQTEFFLRTKEANLTVTSAPVIVEDLRQESTVTAFSLLSFLGELISFYVSDWSKNGQRRALFALFSFYIIYSLFFIGNSVFYDDDATWIVETIKTIESSFDLKRLFFLEKAYGSNLISHSKLASFLHGLVYSLSHSVKSIYYFGVVILIVMHFFIIKADREKRGVLLMSSLTLFFLPAMSIYFNLRSWQLLYFLPSLSISLWGLFNYLKEERERSLIIGAFFLGLSVHFHPSAFFLFPGYFLAVLCLARRKENLYGSCLLAFSVLVLSLFPQITQFFKMNKIVTLVGILVPFLSLHLLNFLKEKVSLNFNVVRNGLVFFVVSFIFYALFFNSHLLIPFEKLLNIISFPSQWINQKVGEVYPFLRVPSLLSVTTLMFGAAVVCSAFNLRDRFDKAIWLLLFSSLLITGLSGFIFQEWPQQRVLFLTPITVIFMFNFCSSLLSSRKVKYYFSMILSLLLILNSGFLNSVIRKNGGINTHCSSLETKREVLKFINAKSTNPQIMTSRFRTDQWSGCFFDGGGYPVLQREFYKEGRQPEGDRFLILEPESTGFLAIEETSKLRKIHQIKNVSIYKVLP
jgi:glycosyltransferase involved in cell wall biosynthesis